MRHHVQYHNPAKNPPLKRQEADFGIRTRETPGAVGRGGRIRGITRGDAQPDYFVLEWFTVHRLEANMPHFENVSWEHEGQFFGEAVRIDREAGLQALVRNQGIFGCNLSPITDRHFVRGLHRAIRAHAPGILPTR